MAAVAFNIGMAFIYICKKRKKESGNKSFTLTVSTSTAASTAQ